MSRSSFLRLLLLFLASSTFVYAQDPPPFHVLAFYSENVERDHVDFAHQAIQFYNDMAQRDHFTFTATTDWSQLETDNLAHYDLVLWLNDRPERPGQRAAFEQYMTHGGRWLGFHVAGFNDADTRWPWFTKFLGGGVFFGNSWPPLPAELVVEDRDHPINKGIPGTFLSPANEWYIWKPSPRLNKDVKVLVSLSPSNYPIGFKETITAGDVPVVWTNSRFRMIYINMGHGDRIFSDKTQNILFENALLWLREP